jgi:hypothetical protein
MEDRWNGEIFRGCLAQLVCFSESGEWHTLVREGLEEAALSVSLCFSAISLESAPEKQHDEQSPKKFKVS